MLDQANGFQSWFGARSARSWIQISDCPFLGLVCSTEKPRSQQEVVDFYLRFIALRRRESDVQQMLRFDV